MKGFYLGREVHWARISSSTGHVDILIVLLVQLAGSRSGCIYFGGLFKDSVHFFKWILDIWLAFQFMNLRKTSRRNNYVTCLISGILAIILAFGYRESPRISDRGFCARSLAYATFLAERRRKHLFQLLSRNSRTSAHLPCQRHCDELHCLQLASKQVEWKCYAQSARDVYKGNYFALLSRNSRA